MDSILLSVIIPVYNAEKYLDRVINSVLKQENNQVEIILVDDGSTDMSREICDNYAENSNYSVVVIHKENGGISTARNAGVRAAKGKYVSFLDADDYMDINSYEDIIDVINECEPDCLDFGYRYVNQAGKTNYINKLPKKILLNKQTIKNIILPPLLNLEKNDDNFIFDFAVNKIYKKKILEKHNILFDETRRTWEDRIFVVNYLKYCENYYSMDQCYYNYVDVVDSLSRKYDLQFFDIIVENYSFYKKEFEDEYDFNRPYVWSYWCKSIEKMIIRSLRENKETMMIEEHIKSVLKEEQIIEWFKKRIAENKDEEKVSEWVVKGECDKIIKFYRNKIKNDYLNTRMMQIKGQTRKICAKVFRFFQ